MPWHRNEPDPLDARRRELAEQERRVAEQMSHLTEQLRQSGGPASADIKPVEPPVWRMEDEGFSSRVPDPTPARKRNLARQRQRDMIFFFIILGLFLVALVIGLWVAYVRNTAPNNGA